MLSDSLKNYVKCLKYLLITMGIVYFFFIMAAALFVQGAGGIVGAQSSAVYARLRDYFSALLGNKDVALFASGNFWYEVFDDVMQILQEGGSGAVAQAGILVGVCAAVIVIGIKLSESVSAYFFKKEQGDANTRYGLLNWIAKYLIGLFFAAMFAVFLFAWKYGGLVVIAVYLLINAAQTLYTVWFVYLSKADRKEFGKTKNVLKVICIMFLCYAMFAALFYLLYWFVSPVLAFVLAVPLFVYTDLVITVTTLTYFKKRYGSKAVAR